jgi:Holliday junction resolvase RusA-like endonuclease
MPSVELFLPIIPKAQKRDRITTIAGHARSYKDKTQRIEEDNLRSLLYRELPQHVLWPLKTAVRLSITVNLPIPVSTPRKLKLLMAAEEVRHIKRPDLDNLAKNIKDVGSGVIWEDDRQIWDLRIIKRYSEEPGWYLRIDW